MASCDDRVLSLLLKHNKPFNVQATADMLAQHGVKKMQVQRSLDSLAEAGKITAKEFGKTKIYFPVQSSLPVLSKEELAARQEEAKNLNAQVKAEEEVVSKLGKALAALRSSLTLKEIEAANEELTVKIQKAEAELAAVSKGARQIKAEDMQQMEQEFELCMAQWRKRRSIFKQIWDTISENIDRNKTELFEEIGIETDEQVGCSVEEFTRLLPKRRRR